MTVMSQQHFYGRKKKLELLKRRVLDLKEGYRQNMAFLGERFMGKTMIVRKFLTDLDDPKIVAVYIDFENSDLAYFFYKMAGSLLYHYTRSRGLPTTDDLSVLINSSENDLPETVNAIKNITTLLASNRDEEVYAQIILLPQIYAQESDTYCVLFFDEFQHIEDYGVSDEFQLLGKAIMTQRRCLYVVTSSQWWVAQKILSEKLTLLFGNFEVVDIKPFNMKTSREFVLYQLPGLKISETLLHFVVDFTAGHPLYLTLICEELRTLSATNKQSEIFLPLLTRAMEDMLRKRWGVLSRHFDLIIDRIASGKGNVVVSRILISLANSRQKLNELSTSLNLKQAVVSARINRLVELGVIAKNGNYFYISDRLFKYWIKFVFYKRRRVIEDEDQRLSAEFRNEFIQAYETSCANGRKDVSSQVLELLSCFENEAISINGRRYKLPTFRQMTPTRVRMSSGGHMDLIRAVSDEGEWLIVLKTGAVCENEISNLLAETKRIVHKPQKCVLISFDGLDENARIRALQERMWIWDEGELNTLASIFDKSFITKV